MSGIKNDRGLTLIYLRLMSAIRTFSLQRTAPLIRNSFPRWQELFFSLLAGAAEREWYQPSGTFVTLEAEEAGSLFRACDRWYGELLPGYDPAFGAASRCVGIVILVLLLYTHSRGLELLRGMLYVIRIWPWAWWMSRHWTRVRKCHTVLVSDPSAS
jgi:hypothetical protein